MRGDEHKHDGGKPDWSLLPFGPIEQIVRVLDYGAREYRREGWRTVPDAKDRYFSALMRHLTAWRNGEAKDPESGLHHLSHAACNVVFLLWFELQGETS